MLGWASWKGDGVAISSAVMFPGYSVRNGTSQPNSASGKCLRKSAVSPSMSCPRLHTCCSGTRRRSSPFKNNSVACAESIKTTAPSVHVHGALPATNCSHSAVAARKYDSAYANSFSGTIKCRISESVTMCQDICGLTRIRRLKCRNKMRHFNSQHKFLNS